MPARKGPVVIAIVGDIHFEGNIRPQLLRDPEMLLEPVAPILRRADIAIGNLETAITTRGKPQPKMYTFRAPMTAFQALRAGGIMVASMANNHGMDFGIVGLQDTLAAAAQENFAIIGIGQNARQAYGPYTVLIRGERVSFLAATQVLDVRLRRPWTATDTKPGIASAKLPALRRLLASVRDARKISDTVIVYLHWGKELASCPTDAQEILARQLVHVGADIVVGSHAHVLLGRGYLGRAYVDYGLGNFVFYARGGVAAQTGILTLTVRGRDTTAVAWAPAIIRDGIPHPLSRTQDALAMSASERLRNCTNLAATPKSL